jgi:hypothetical protein
MISIVRREQPRAAVEQQRARPRAINLTGALELGDSLFFAFRGRAYRVPMLPWRSGELILDAWLEIESYGTEITRENRGAYYACIQRLEKLIWANVRPVGFVNRILYRLGLMRNPFRHATEREIVERSHFLLRRRMNVSGSTNIEMTTKRPDPGMS